MDPASTARGGNMELVPFTFTARGHLTHPAAKRVEALATSRRRHGLDVELSGMMFSFPVYEKEGS